MHASSRLSTRAAPLQYVQSASQCTMGHGHLSEADHALVALGRYYLVWNWDNAIWGTSCLLAALQPGLVTRYSTEIEGFLASWINGNNGITVTPKGLAWTTEWGSLRNSANAGLFPCVDANGFECCKPACCACQASKICFWLLTWSLHVERAKPYLRGFLVFPTIQR